MTWGHLAMLIGAIAATIAIIAALIAAARWLWRLSRRIGRFLDDWFGDPERDQPSMPIRVSRMETRLGDVDRRLAGVDAEVATVKLQLHPNGGSSVADAVKRIEQAVAVPSVQVNVTPPAMPAPPVEP